MRTIRVLVNQGIKVLQQMRINYNSPIRPNTMQLINTSKQLIPELQKEQPEIADILNNALFTINFNGFISAYSFGYIRTRYRILASLTTILKRYS